MVKDNHRKLGERDRRKFLKLAGTAGVAGMGLLAGCNTESGDSENTASGENDTADTGEGGEKLPTYQYYVGPQSGYPTYYDTVNLAAEQFGELGLDVEVNVFEWATIYDRVEGKQNFDFATWWRPLGVYPGGRLQRMFHSENTDQGGANFTGYENSDLDQKLDKQMVTSDDETRIDLLYDIQETITEACAMNPYTQHPNLMAYNSDNVGGWIDHLLGYNNYINMTEINVSNPDNLLVGTYRRELDSMNTLTDQGDANFFQHDLMYDRLVRFNSNLEYAPKYSLATDLSRPDAKTVEYTIRDHQWHDGEPLTAEDVAFTINFLKDNKVPKFSQQNKHVSDAEVIGDNEIRVNLSEQLGPVHEIISYEYPIIPKHKWESRGPNPQETFIENPVGSGPLMFDYWSQGSEISLKANENHWLTPDYDRRVWRIIPQTSTIWQLLQQGEIHYFPFTPMSKQLSERMNSSSIEVAQSPGRAWWHLSMNTDREGLTDKALRQGLVHAMPRTAVVEQILHGFPEPGFNLVSPAYGRFHNPDVPKFEEGIEPAKERLREAGYEWDDDGNLLKPID